MLYIISRHFNENTFTRSSPYDHKCNTSEVLYEYVGLYTEGVQFLYNTSELLHKGRFNRNLPTRLSVNIKILYGKTQGPNFQLQSTGYHLPQTQRASTYRLWRKHKRGDDSSWMWTAAGCIYLILTEVHGSPWQRDPACSDSVLMVTGHWVKQSTVLTTSQGSTEFHLHEG